MSFAQGTGDPTPLGMTDRVAVFKSRTTHDEG